MNATSIAVMLLVVSSYACAAGGVQLHTGASFERELDQPSQIFWADVPLRQALKQLSQARGVGVWLDRRCDPSLPMNLQLRTSRFSDCLWQLSESYGELDVSWFGNMIYVGPPDAANRIATLHEIHQRTIRKLPKPEREIWLQTQEWDFADLTSPQDLLAVLQDELGASIQGKQLVLHDLWPATHLPPLPLYQRLEILLAGFDLSFRVNAAGGAEIVPMPSQPQFPKSLHIPKSKQATIQRSLVKPDVLKDSRLTASWKVHQHVVRLLKAKQVTRPRSTAETRYSLSATEQPVGPFLQQLCRQLGIECRFQNITQSQLNGRVSFAVQQATLDELLQAIVTPADLQFQLHEKRGLLVSAKLPADTHSLRSIEIHGVGNSQVED